MATKMMFCLGPFCFQPEFIKIYTIKTTLITGIQALKQIHKLQKTTNLLIPDKPFYRAVRSITKELDLNKELRFQNKALMCLHVSLLDTGKRIF
jgi:hypothetical protein